MGLVVISVVLGFGILCLSRDTDGTEVPPANVRVFAMTFMDLDLTKNDRSYTQILISTVDKSKLRVKIPFAHESKYSNIRWSDWGQTYFNFTDNKIDFSQANALVVSKNKGAIVVAKDTVSVFGSHAMAGSGEAYLALPIIRRSHNFYLASYPSIQGVGSSFYGLAAAVETCVDVYLISNGTYAHHKSIHMQAGDVYQEYSSSGDFTGLNVQSAQGVAVFSGHECAQVPVGLQYCDHLLEQMPPTHEWDDEMVVPGIPGRNPKAGYTVRIIAAEEVNVSCLYSGTEVYLSEVHGCDCSGRGYERIEFGKCTQPCTILQAEFIELNVTDATKAVLVKCRPRCMVVQYGHSRQKVADEKDDPDPFMAVITPTSHYARDMSYVTPDYLDPTRDKLLDHANYLAIVVPTAEEGGVLFDGEELSPAGKMTLDRYTVMSVHRISDGQHKIEHAKRNVRIGAFAYGNTPAKSETRPAARSSYGFPVVYRVSGETVKGDWMEDLVAKPEDDVVTFPPKHCIQTEVNSVHDTFTISANKTFKSCTEAEMTSSVLDRFRARVNQAICEDILCFGLPDNVFISHLRFSDTNKINALHFRMATTMDTPMSSLLQCKKDIISYVTYPDHWSDILTSKGLASCRQLIRDLLYTNSIYSCGPSGI